MSRSRKIQKLNIYQNGHILGTLERATSGAISFQYAPEWLSSDDSLPVSMNLPLREMPYKGTEVSEYFDNLLPDNEKIREKIASQIHAESEKFFDLLYAIGKDCVGALQLIPEGNKPPHETDPKGEAISESEIANKLKNLSFFPLGLNPEITEFRISIAGAQEKTALLLKKGKWFVPTGTTPTTHIFKPPMGIIHSGIDLTTSVENEWLCLQICRNLGLEVTNAQMDKFEDQKCLIVERFDRKWVSPKRLIRIPQEDLCQALGFPSTKKYQADRGPGINSIMRFLDASDERTKDKASFMRAQLVFFLLAATDVHAKNFSIFLTKTGFRLTPLYDVMSVFPAISKKQMQKQRATLAMSIGDSNHYKIAQISRRHFEQTAKACGFSKKDLDLLIEDLQARVPKLESAIQPPKGFPEWIFESIMNGIKKQREKLSGT